MSVSPPDRFDDGSMRRRRQQAHPPPPDGDERFVCRDEGGEDEPNRAGCARRLHADYVVDDHVSLSVVSLRYSLRTLVAIG